MRIAIRGHDVVAAGSLNFALIRSATKAANRAAPAVGGGTAAPAQAAVDGGEQASSGPVFSSEEKTLADAERIVQMSDDELREICRILKLDTSGEHSELANRVLAHSNLEHLAAAVTQVKAGN